VRVTAVDGPEVVRPGRREGRRIRVPRDAGDEGLGAEVGGAGDRAEAVALLDVVLDAAGRAGGPSQAGRVVGDRPDGDVGVVGNVGVVGIVLDLGREAGRGRIDDDGLGAAGAGLG